MKKLRLSVLVFLAAAQLGAAFGFAHHGGVGTARPRLHPSRIESPKTGLDGRVTGLYATSTDDPELSKTTDVGTWIAQIDDLDDDPNEIAGKVRSKIGKKIGSLLTYETADELKADLKSAGGLGADANRIVDALKEFDPTWAPSTPGATRALRRVGTRLQGEDGLDPSLPFLKRAPYVEAIYSRAQERKFVVVGSPPSTGKTSLLQLTMARVQEEDPDALMIFYSCPPTPRRNFDTEVRSPFVRDTKVDLWNGDALQNTLKSRGRSNCWIFLDEAQKWYGDFYEAFWQQAVKALSGFAGEYVHKIHFVIAATYDYSIGGSPVVFQNQPHVPSAGFPLVATDSELHELWCNASAGEPWEHFSDYEDRLITISNGNIGVFSQGMKTLYDLALSPPRDLDESRAVRSLYELEFFYRCKRCFLRREPFSPTAEQVVVAALGKINSVDGLFPDVADLYNSSLRSANAGRPELKAKEGTSEEDGEFASLVRCGVLSPSGSFSSQAAMNFYHNLMFPHRARTMPEKTSAEDLAVECVKKFSSSTLRRSAKAAAGKKVPYEAVFLHLFHTALLSLTPTSVPLIQQAPTVLPPDVRGFIDLFANGDLQHGYELLRDGTRDEHARRFAPQGRYSDMNYRDRLVLDFIVEKEVPPSSFPALSAEVEKLNVVATFAFDENFTKCAYKVPSGSTGDFILPP